jgi:hypothetical protein
LIAAPGRDDSGRPPRPTTHPGPGPTHRRAGGTGGPS